MTPQLSPSTTLNPFAPVYTSIVSGVTPSPHARSPFFFPPLPGATFLQPYAQPSAFFLQPPLPSPPFFPSPQIVTYIPSLSQRPFYTYCSTVSNHNAVPNSPLPQPPPPPQDEGVLHGSRTERSCTSPSGGRGRGRFCRSRVDESGHSDFGRRLNTEQDRVLGSEKSFRTVGVQIPENRHRVMPLKRDEEKTTVMIKNVPYDCPRKELIRLLDDFCSLENNKVENEVALKGGDLEEGFPYAYDFIYLPIDFRSKRSRGFAFVNFTTARAVWKFFDSFHLKKWGFSDRRNWAKVIEIVAAELQGKEALMNHFTKSVFVCETDEFLPACFSPPRVGSGQPVKVTAVGKRREPPARDSLN